MRYAPAHARGIGSTAEKQAAPTMAGSCDRRKQASTDGRIAPPAVKLPVGPRHVAADLRDGASLRLILAEFPRLEVILEGLY